MVVKFLDDNEKEIIKTYGLNSKIIEKVNDNNDIV